MYKITKCNCKQKCLEDLLILVNFGTVPYPMLLPSHQGYDADAVTANCLYQRLNH